MIQIQSLSYLTGSKLRPCSVTTIPMGFVGFFNFFGIFTYELFGNLIIKSILKISDFFSYLVPCCLWGNKIYSKLYFFSQKLQLMTFQFFSSSLKITTNDLYNFFLQSAANYINYFLLFSFSKLLFNHHY